MHWFSQFQICTWVHCFLNFETLRNLPPEPAPAHTGTFRNFPKPSGTCFRNLHKRASEPSGTCLRNLPRAHRNVLEPSRTCACDPHRRTPELFWAEDPIRSHKLMLLGKKCPARHTEYKPAGSAHPFFFSPLNFYPIKHSQLP